MLRGGRVQQGRLAPGRRMVTPAAVRSQHSSAAGFLPPSRHAARPSAVAPHHAATSAARPSPRTCWPPVWSICCLQRERTPSRVLPVACAASPPREDERSGPEGAEPHAQNTASPGSHPTASSVPGGAAQVVSPVLPHATRKGAELHERGDAVAGMHHD
jgi:hypothetical protein